MERADTKPVDRVAALGHARVEVVCTPELLTPAAQRWLEDQANRAMELLGTSGEVRVRVVRDAVMAAAHEGFAGVPGTTDVLTFDLADPGSGALDVDILACIDEAARQGALRGHSVERELLLYIIHGILHCLGHDDHDPGAAARMHVEEDRILEALGVGATFGGRGDRAGTGDGAP